MAQRSGGEPLYRVAALWYGSKRLPGTSAGVAMAQRLEGSRFYRVAAL
jgi:hypothetical protein